MWCGKRWPRVVLHAGWLRFKDWCRINRHRPAREQPTWLSAVLVGHGKHSAHSALLEIRAASALHSSMRWAVSLVGLPAPQSAAQCSASGEARVQRKPSVIAARDRFKCHSISEHLKALPKSQRLQGAEGIDFGRDFRSLSSSRKGSGLTIVRTAQVHTRSRCRNGSPHLVDLSPELRESTAAVRELETRWANGARAMLAVIEVRGRDASLRIRRQRS